MKSESKTFFNEEDNFFSASAKVGCVGFLLTFILTFTIPLEILALATDGIVFKFLWNWFLVPVYSVPVLTIVQGMGTLIAFRFLIGRHLDRSEVKLKETTVAQDLWKLFAQIVLIPGSILLTAWIFHFLFF